MLRLIIAALLMLQLQVQAKEYYSIVGPGTIRPNSNYSIVVTVHDLKQACKIKLGIEGPQFDKKEEVTVQPLSVKKVDLWIPDIVKGDYSLIAEGVSGINFKNRTILNFMEVQSAGIYVQTDKAMYKPGDLLQFRVIFLNEHMKPAVIKKPIEINVENSEKIRIKQFTNIKLTSGVFKEQVQLSEFTKIGEWQISVKINGESVKNKTFRVEKYVLPKFEVKIDAPQFIGISENFLKFTIHSKYTYGKPVKGYATINIFKSFNMTNLYNMTKYVEGKNEIIIDMKSILPKGLENSFNERLHIQVKVKDNITNEDQSTSVKIDVMQHPTIIKTPKTVAECESPDDMFAYPISVTNVDKNNKKRINIILRDEENGDETITKQLNDKGETSVSMKCGMDEKIVFEILYDGITVYRELIRQKFIEEDKVGVHVKTLNPKIGKPIIVHLKSDVPFKDFIYIISSGGNIAASDIVSIDDDDETESYVFQITPTFEMIPEAYIYVHFVENNNYRFYETSFKLPKQFQNKLTIRAPNATKPAEEIKLKVKTDINSYVGLLAVDKSVLLLKAGNDLSASDILDDFESFTGEVPEIYLETKNSYPGEESGLVTLTNAHFPFTYEKEDKEKGDPKFIKRSINTPRSKFPETWFFDDFESTNKMLIELKKTVPDTITTWIVTGFSLNPDTGLALTKTPVEIQTFIKFFITTNLPYSIKRGEAILIPVVVYNYMKYELQVGVTLSKNDDDFEFIEEDEAKQSLLSLAPVNDGVTVYFAIRPKRIGYITLKITAESIEYTDTLEIKLKVEPEGLTEFKNHEHLMKAGEKRKFKIDIPDDRIPNTEYIEVTTTQYILGSMLSTISNPDALENLIRKPVGCGEQNMIYLVPNIMVLDYLKSIGKLTTKIEKAAKNFIEVGYQNELNYRHDDGSFSTWGKNSNSKGSTWLTAYVMRSFQQASKHITIDSKILDEGFRFLSKKQNAEGRFVEDGSLTDLTYHNNIVITAFVLLAFLEDKHVANKYNDVINRGYQYLENNINIDDADMYSLSITAYVLQIRKPEVVKNILPKLEEKAKTDNEYKWWTKRADINNWISPATHDNEVTSYVLMALLDLNEHVEPTVKWLISKRNSNGGFASTQETAVGLAALAKFSTKNTVENANLIIDIVDLSNSALQGTFTISDKDNFEMQKLVLDNKIRDIELKTRGLGTAVLQVSYRYNILKNAADDDFIINVNTLKEDSLLHLQIDFKLNALDIDVRLDVAKTNMVLMEVHLPTGYAADTEYLASDPKISEIDHVELQNADTKLIIYFTSLEAFKQIQFSLKAIRLHKVAELKPSLIKVYDYIDSGKSGIYYYEIPSPLCEMCSDDECSIECEDDE